MYSSSRPATASKTRRELSILLKERFDIDHSTLQVDYFGEPSQPPASDARPRRD
jgi:hypothetical protein